ARAVLVGLGGPLAPAAAGLLRLVRVVGGLRLGRALARGLVGLGGRLRFGRLFSGLARRGTALGGGRTLGTLVGLRALLGAFLGRGHSRLGVGSGQRGDGGGTA